MSDSDKTKEQLIQEIELLRPHIDTLRESVARYKAIFESAKEGILIADVETKQPQYANQALCRMFGYTEEEFCRKTIYDIHPGNQAKEIEDSFAMHQQNKGGKLLVNRPCLRKDGSVFFADIKILAVMVNQKMCHLVFFTDTTERKQTEDALHESESRYRAIFETAREGILVGVTETRQFMYANSAICKMFGYTAEEMTHLAVNDIHPKESLQYASDRFKAFMRDEAVFTQNMPCLRKNGTVFYADISATHIVIDSKDCFVGFFTDTTKRKQTEDALRESEARYKAIFESAREGILVADIETKQFKYANPASCEMFGYSADELTRMTLNDIHRKESLAEVKRDFDARTQGNKEISRNVPCLRKNGTLFYADINTARVLIDNRPCLAGFFTDITQRKQAEDALRESEARYKAIFNYATEGIIVTDVETKRHKYVNPAACRMFGYTAEEFQQMSVYDIHPKEYIPSVIAGFEAQAQSKKTLVPNVPCLHKNGTVFYADIDATCVVIDQRPCNVGLFTNITERKNTEEALRQSEEKFRGIAERSFDMIFTMDTKGNFKYISPACERLYALKPQDVVGKNFRYFVTKDYLSTAIDNFTDVIKGRVVKPFVTELQREEFAPVFVEVNMSPVLQNGKVIEVQGVIRDETKPEEALRQSEEKFRGLAERSSEMIFTTDTRGLITYLSPASEKIFGYKTEEMVGKNFTMFLAESEIPKAVKKFTEKLRGQNHGVLYLEAKRKGGSRVFIELSSSLIIQDGKTAGTQGIIKDVTESKKAEEQLKKAHEELETRVKQRTAALALAVEKLQKEIAERKLAEETLHKTEERFRSVFENTIVGLYRTTPDGQILLANPALIKMMGCRSFKELASFNVEKSGFDPSTPRSRFKKLIKKEGRVIGLESTWRRPDGKKLFVSESAFAVKDAKGKIQYYEGTAQDVTKRKEAEEKLMQYQQQLRSLASELSQAEERLRRRIAAELHDNIAQNLAISKIKLESLTGDDKPELTKSINEVTGLIAQTIDATRTLTFEISPPVLYELGFETAVGWLVRQTRQRFGLNVEFIDDKKPKPLNMDIRVLLFQAVRELLVNAVKHAKAEKAKVSIRKVDGNVQIAVEDNGVGFDTSTAGTPNYSTKEGFGLFNIKERLDQAGGNVIIHSGHNKGTRIILIAPIEKQKKSHTRFSDASSEKKGRRPKKKK